MNPAEWDAQWKRLSALYPRDFHADDVETMGAWGGFFRHHDSGAVTAAVNGWTGSHRRAPAIADVMELIRSEKRQTDAYTVRDETTCGHCDHGWEWLPSGDVMACRNGCRPPLPDNSFRAAAGERSNSPENIQSLRATLGAMNPGWRPRRGKATERRDPSVQKRGPQPKKVTRAWESHSKTLGRGDKPCTCELCMSGVEHMIGNKNEELG